MVGAGNKVPIIVSKADGGFYVATSTTALRKTTKTQTEYVAIADHIYNKPGFDKYTKGKIYNTLEEAYGAYAELVEKSYPTYKYSLLK